MSETESKGMGIAGIAATVVVIGYFAFELYGLHKARDRMEPAQVYADFVRARYAVSACAAEPDGRTDFERNFDAVTRLATRDLAEQEDELTPAQLDEALAERRLAIEDDVDILIAEQGCDGKAVWRLKKLYEARSRLKLRY